ncbi:MAG: T9SS type A sorting domain-containing protein [Bacteroidia bacterium]
MKLNVYAILFIALLMGFASEATAQLTWAHHGPEALGNRTRSIVFDANGNLFAASAGGGIYTSTSKGRSWIKLEGYTGNPTVTALASNGNKLYAGTGEITFLQNAIHTSGWQPSFADGTPGFIGLPGSGVYVSTDNGASWSNDNATTKDFPTESYDGPFLGVQKIAVGEGGRVFVATREGLFYSDDDFQTLNQPEGPDDIKNEIIFDIEVNGSTVFIGSEEELYTSKDNGATFTKTTVDPVRQNLSTVRVEIAISSDDPNIMYVGSSGSGSAPFRGVFRSDNAGENWRPYSPTGSATFNPLGNNENAARDSYVMTVKPGDPDELIVTGNNWFIYNNELGWSKNGVQHFDANSIFAPGKYLPTPIYSIAINPNDPSEMFVGTGSNIMRSLDRGNTFRPTTAGYGSSNIVRVGAWSVYGEGGQRAVLASTDIHGVTTNVNYWKNQIGPDTNPGDIDSTWSPATKRFGTLEGAGGGRNSQNYSQLAFSYLFPGSMIVEGADQGLVKSDGTFGSSFAPFYSLPLNTDTILRPSSGVVDSVVYRGLDGISGSDIFIDRANASVTSASDIGSLFDASPAYPMHAFAIDEYIPDNYIAPGDASLSELLEYPDRDSLQKLPNYVYYTSKRYAWLVNFTFSSGNGLNPRWDRISNNVLGREEFFTVVTPASDGSNSVYFGTSAGKIFRIDAAPDLDFYNATLNSGNIIEISSQAGGAPIDYTSTMDGRWITDIAVNPEDPSQIAVTFAGYGGEDPLSYLWLIEGANTITTTFIPVFDGPGGFEQAYAAQFAKDPSSGDVTLLVGTESGLYSTKDLNDSPTWKSEMPASYGKHPIYDIYLQKYKTIIVDDRTGDFRLQEDNTIYVGSHGNGVWSTTDLGFSGRTGGGIVGEEITISDPVVKLYPNPSEGANTQIGIALPGDAQVEATVYTMDGRQIATINRQGYLAGEHVLDLTSNNIQPGIYLVQVQITDAQQTANTTLKWVVK